MNNTLPLKINDYCNYVGLAVKYYKDSFYPDAAINCRKAAEAACKIIIHNAYSEKLADTKLNNKSLKELIILLIHEGVTERKTINTLETLQIIGNKAAHDNAIGKDETTYAIHALNLFTEYLFKEHLKISIPKTLDAIFKEPQVKKISPANEVVEKIIVQEKFNKETEDQLFSKIKDIEQKSEGDANKVEELKQELMRSQQKIQELSRQKQTENDQIEPSKKKLAVIKNIFISLLILLILSGIVFSIKYFFWEKPATGNVADNFQLNKSPDSIYVAINSFQVLQDNPNIDYKIEQIIYNRINNVKQSNNLPISLVKTNFKGNNTPNDTLLIKQAARAGFDMLYYGNLYETALTDSNVMEINCSVINDQNYRNSKIKFKTLSDSTIIKEVTDQGNMPVYLYTQIHISDKPARQMLALMQSLNYYSSEQLSSVYNFTACFKRDLKDYKAALQDVDLLIRKNPGKAYFLSFKANLFTFENKPDSAIAYFDKALKTDSADVSTLINYANLGIRSKDYKKSEQLLKKAIQVAPKDYHSFYAMAYLKMEQKEYLSAKFYALKANRLYKDDPANSVIIASIYGFVENKKDSAEYFYRQALSKDSANADALNSLANYYLRFFTNDPMYKQKANYLLNKAKVFTQKNDIKNDYGFALTAYDNRDYKTALAYFEKVYKQGTYSGELFTCMAQAYYYTKQSDKALLFSKKALEMDSLNSYHLMVHALLLGYIQPKNYQAVCYYYNKALAADPGLLNLYREYGTYLYRAGKVNECINLSLKGYKLFGTDIKINSLLAYAYTNQKNYQKAKPYFEYLTTVKPDNDTLLCDFAQIILLNFQQIDETYVYGAKLIKKAIDINPNNGGYYLIFAMYLLKGNNLINAKEYYLNAKKLNPSLYNEELEKIK